jgi:hypothetical protein
MSRRGMRQTKVHEVLTVRNVSTVLIDHHAARALAYRQRAIELAEAARGNVIFIAGTTDGYLFVDQDNSGFFGNPSSGDFAIVLDHLNSTTLFGPQDVFS